MVENASVSEHAWLFVASSGNWQGIVKHGSFGIRYSGILEEAQSGEPCVAYVPRQGQRLFIGLGELTGSYYHDEMQKYPHRVKLDVKLAKNGVSLKSLRSRLQFVNDVPNLGLALRKGALRIPLSDYEVIKEALESPPISTRLQPLMQEGREKVTRNRGIESHAEAEADLLELGNLLGFDTYVTADDRNKEFRGKLLSETATLREMPNFTTQEILDTARHIDIIWFEDKFPVQCFEVEHSTGVSQGLLRLFRLRGLNTGFTIVAPAEAQGKFEREVEKAPFRSIRNRFRFKSYEDLGRFLRVAREFVKEEQNFLGEHRSSRVGNKLEEV